MKKKRATLDEVEHLDYVISEIAGGKLVIVENGRRMKISRNEAMVRSTINQAINREHRGRRQVLLWAKKLGRRMPKIPEIIMIPIPSKPRSETPMKPSKKRPTGD